MSDTNGIDTAPDGTVYRRVNETRRAPDDSAYRRLRERHRAEKEAWRRVNIAQQEIRAARIERAAALADYEAFLQGEPLEPGRRLLAGVIEGLPDDPRDDRVIIENLVAGSSVVSGPLSVVGATAPAPCLQEPALPGAPGESFDCAQGGARHSAKRTPDTGPLATDQPVNGLVELGDHNAELADEGIAEELEAEGADAPDSRMFREPRILGDPKEWIEAFKNAGSGPDAAKRWLIDAISYEATGKPSPAWEALMIQGATDDQIIATLNQVAGHFHDSEDGRDEVYEWRTEPPRFYLFPPRVDEKFNAVLPEPLEGAELVARVREVLKIGLPKQVELVELPAVDYGPADTEQAFGRALRMPEVSKGLDALVRRGVATDAEIRQTLTGWPTHRWRPGTPPGCPWGVVGGDDPRFFAGHAARDGNWPVGMPTYVGASLIKAVRKKLGLKTPKITRAEAKASFAEDLPGDTISSEQLEKMTSKERAAVVMQDLKEIDRRVETAELTAKEKRNARDRARRAREREMAGVSAHGEDARGQVTNSAGSAPVPSAAKQSVPSGSAPPTPPPEGGNRPRGRSGNASAEKADRHVKATGPTRPTYSGRPAGGWTAESLEAAARQLVNTGEPLDHTLVCVECEGIRLTSPEPSKCPYCGLYGALVYRAAIADLQRKTADKKPRGAKSKKKGDVAAELAPDDWQEHLVGVLTARCGIFSSTAHEELIRRDFETIGDIAIALSNGTEWHEFFDGHVYAVELGEELQKAVQAFAAWAKWDETTTYPDGIPLAWIEGDVPQPVDPEGDDTETEGEHADEQLVPSESSPPSPPSRGGEPGDVFKNWTPKKIREANLKAAFLIYTEGAWHDLRKDGATDDEITERLAFIWPCVQPHFVRPPESKTPYGYTIHGDPPTFWLGPIRRDEHDIVVTGQELVDLARKLLGIPTPKSEDEPAAVEPPVVSEGEPWTRADVDRNLRHALQRGRITASLKELATRGATDEEILDRLRTDWPRSRVFTAPDTSGDPFGYTLQCGDEWACLWMGAFKGPGHKATLANAHLADRIRLLYDIPRPAAAPAEAQSEPVVRWTSEDLDRVLKHALTERSIVGVMSQISKLKGKVATSNEIQAALEASWPRRHSDPGSFGSRRPYTIEAKPGECSLWIGPNNGARGRHLKPTLSGIQLVDRVRTVLKIGRPGDASKRPAPPQGGKGRIAASGQKRGTKITPVASATPPFEEMPIGGWTTKWLEGAADELGVAAEYCLRCTKCNAVRSRIHHPCPKCQCPEFRLVSADLRAAASLETPRATPTKKRKAVSNS